MASINSLLIGTFERTVTHVDKSTEVLPLNFLVLLSLHSGESHYASGHRRPLEFIGQRHTRS